MLFRLYASWKKIFKIGIPFKNKFTYLLSVYRQLAFTEQSNVPTTKCVRFVEHVDRYE